MKFGKTFVSHQVPEWSGHYMNYKELKKQINIITGSIDTIKVTHFKSPSPSDLSNQNDENQMLINDYLNDETVQTAFADFFFKIDRNIEKVESFYNFQFSEYERRLRKVTTAIQSNNNRGEKVVFDKEEFEEVIGILVELRGNFRNLKWFAELNKRGFIKILKKLDKKTGSNKQMYYLSSRIFPLSFANESEILRVLKSINGFLSELSPQADELVSVDDSNSANIESESQGSKGYLTPTSTKYADYIKKDDEEGLIKQLITEFRSPILAPSKLMINLLNKSALAQAFKCIDKLMKHIQVLSESSDISGRNFFHHHIIALGKQTAKQREELKIKSATALAKLTSNNDENDRGIKIERDMSLLPAAAPDSNFRLVGAYGSDGVNSNDSTKGLEYILDKLPTSLRPSLLQRDNYKRAPLHYAAQYGLKDTASLVIRYLDKWQQWDHKLAIDDITIWGDTEYLTPLHLSLVGNHPKTTKVLLGSMDKDTELRNPALILLASRLKSPKLLEALLEVKGIDINYNKSDTKETPLYICSKLNGIECVEFLLSKGADCEIAEASFGWTPIFVAAAEGYTEIVKLLIKYGANYSKTDESGWLPMEHCSLRGHIELADLIRPINYDPWKLAKASNLNKLIKKDGGSSSPSNTTASSADSLTLSNHESTSSIDRLPNFKQPLNKIEDATTIYREIKLNRKNSGNNVNDKGVMMAYSNSSQNSIAKPVKSIGHSYLKPNESSVLLTLGTTDLRDDLPAIELNRVPVSRAHSTELDTALSVSISCKQLKNQPPVILDLPLDDNHGSATDPIIFKFKNMDPRDATVYFDIVPTYSYTDDEKYVSINNDLQDSSNGINSVDVKKQKVLGRAIALLSNAYTAVGNDRRSLYNVCTVPIIESDTLEELGTVRFEILSVNSFIHPNNTYNINDSYWKTLITTRVIGHRGLGKNVNSKNSLQLGENTVESFIAAASLGASYVEFDVQLTKDLVPVIYHDFLVAESGMDIPMHQLTAEQFLGLSEVRPDQRLSDRNGHHGDGIRRNQTFFKNNRISYDDDVLLQNRKFRSKSVSNKVGFELPKDYETSSNKNEDEEDEEEESLSSIFDERMKLTKTYKANKFKGNSRGSSIASSFVTLEDLFKKLPENVGFNVECKYPMLEEAQREEFEEIAISLNKWVDVVLKMVYDLKKDRNIIFSSFHPDICILLSLKQPSIPILFLTESGSQFMPDARASSLQAAIRFAKKWNLLGIVSAAEPIIQCPRLASIVKSNGLVCFTYGTLNNDPENARLEMEAGVDAVIVDKVLAVRKGLTSAT